MQAVASAQQIVDLRELSGGDLHPLLSDEIEEWSRELDWDFSKSAALVRRLAEARELGGVAMLDGGEVAAYGYCGFAEGKGQIWDVYVRPRWRGGNAGTVLFRVLLEALRETAGLRRVECQLMLLDPAAAGELRFTSGMRCFERQLMKFDTDIALGAGNRPAGTRFRLEPWEDGHLAAAAQVLARAHVGHVDCKISDQYRSVAGARRFLEDMVQFPGCAAFSREASYVAFDSASGEPAGISVTSFVAPGVGHIAELAVTPGAKGQGLGYELLRRSATALRDAGAKRISLTVTADNSEAVRLYRRAGFRESRRFWAFSWEKP